MNERVEAAAQAAHVSKLTGVRWCDIPGWKRSDRLDEARAALAAADAVMFSEESVRRAVKALYKEQTTGNPYGGLDLQVKAVIAALKGAGDE